MAYKKRFTLTKNKVMTKTDFIDEKSVASLVASDIKINYPTMIHRFDVGADIRLTMGQAVHIKNKLHHERGFPDLMLFEMRGGYGAMFLELKKNRGEVFTKKGGFRNDIHNIEQRNFHKRLREKGYFVEYGFGFDDAVAKIKSYMKLKMTVCRVKRSFADG